MLEMPIPAPAAPKPPRAKKAAARSVADDLRTTLKDVEALEKRSGHLAAIAPALHEWLDWTDAHDMAQYLVGPQKKLYGVAVSVLRDGSGGKP